MRILAINGSYRDQGITDQTVEIMLQVLHSAGADAEQVKLRDYPIEFCTNCRQCTQQPGESPGTCVQQDGMHALIEKIEQADGFILASPTNFGTVTALFKRFMERLIVYAWWPWGMKAPKPRKVGGVRKKALLVSSCAAPGLLGRLMYTTHRQLKDTARVIGADSVGGLFTGLVAGEPHAKLPPRTRRRAETLVRRLLG